MSCTGRAALRSSRAPEPCRRSWLDRGAARGRGGLLWGAIGLSGLVSAVIALPVLPVRQTGPVIAMNGDVGETIGWPALARTVARVYDRTEGNPVIFTSNYGEAGGLPGHRVGQELQSPCGCRGRHGLLESRSLLTPEVLDADLPVAQLRCLQTQDRTGGAGTQADAG